MKTFFKKSNIFSFILGAIIFGSIGVVASQLFASDIGYTPFDSSFKKINGENITNVAEAIDELYAKSQTPSASRVSSFNFTSTATQQVFNIGYKPRYIACSADNINDSFIAIVYDESVDNSIITRSNGTTGSLELFYTLNDNGFSWNVVNNIFWDNRTIYCTAVE